MEILLFTKSIHTSIRCILTVSKCLEWSGLLQNTIQNLLAANRLVIELNDIQDQVKCCTLLSFYLWKKCFQLITNLTKSGKYVPLDDTNSLCFFSFTWKTLINLFTKFSAQHVVKSSINIIAVFASKLLKVHQHRTPLNHLSVIVYIYSVLKDKSKQT